MDYKMKKISYLKLSQFEKESAHIDSNGDRVVDEEKFLKLVEDYYRKEEIK